MAAGLSAIDRRIAATLQGIGPWLLRISLAVVFTWFGALKLVGQSPANDLIARTVVWFPPANFIPVLGVWEIAIGLCMLIKPLNRAGVLLLALQMPGTLLPLFLLPGVCFTHVPWAPTLEGQYIIKNVVLISAALVVGGAVRSRR